MGKTLYLDCTNGISGDMCVAALLDLGANEARLRDALASLPVDGYEIRVSRVKKAGIDCCDFDVVLDAAHENHDHDMAYLHGAGHDHGPAPVCDHHHHDHHHGHACDHHHHDHGHHDHHDHACGHHHHDHAHAHAHGPAGHHEHRGPADIDRIIDDAGQLAPRARELAHRMVAVLAAAEAKAHAVPLDEVHFHEVGAIDSIVDIVSVAVSLDDLDVDRVIVPGLVDGRGTVRCQHGVVPIPVPATLNIVQEHGIPLSICDVEGELVTPTGAAIVAATQAEHELPERFRVVGVGIGAGKRAYRRPSMLRAMVIEEMSAPRSASTAQDAGAQAQAPTIDAAHFGAIMRLECDIDDASGEMLAYAAERLREAGAREVHWVPVFAKKGRPAWQLQVVATPEDVERLESIIFAETTTIGIRRWACDRTPLPRAMEVADTPWGPVRMKTVTLPDGARRSAPEYEDAAAIARRTGLPLGHVMQAALEAHGAREA